MAVRIFKRNLLLRGRKNSAATFGAAGLILLLSASEIQV
jgi:hypothetical protein